MTILLVRHAESLGNFDDTAYETTADHAMRLTEKGHAQARALGLFLKDWYRNNPPQNNIRLWCSPYQRTYLTLRDMKDSMGEWAWDKCSRGRDIQFDDRLREKDWGYYKPDDYQPGGKLQQDNALLYAHYRRTRDAEMGRYYSRPYGGESNADVADRMRSFFHDLYFDINRGVTDHLIITHGAAIMAFTYAFTKTHPRFMNDESFAGNTSVRLLAVDRVHDRYADYGYIYEPGENIYLLDKPAQPLQRDLAKILA